MDNPDLRAKFELQLAKNVIEMNKIRRFPILQRMLNEHGYFYGAKRLINGEETSGLAELFNAGKQHLSVEALALQVEFQPLFSESELKNCRNKLGLSR